MKVKVTAHQIANAHGQHQRRWLRYEAYSKIRRAALWVLAFLIVGGIIFGAAYLAVRAGTDGGLR